MMRQSSKPCIGLRGFIPPLSRCLDYLPAYPLRLVGFFLAAENQVGISYLLIGVNPGISPIWREDAGGPVQVGPSTSRELRTLDYPRSRAESAPIATP